MIMLTNASDADKSRYASFVDPVSFQTAKLAPTVDRWNTHPSKDGAEVIISCIRCSPRHGIFNEASLTEVMFRN